MSISKEFKVGFFGIISLSILYCGGMFMKGSEVFSARNNHYYAYADNVEGLVEGTKILINGVKVGLIKNLEFLPEDNCKTKITFSIDKNVKLNKNSYLKTVGNLTGAKSLRLQIEKGEALNDGDEIKFSQGADIVSEITQKGSPIVSDVHLVLDKLNLFLENLNENNQGIKNTVTNLEKTTKNLNDTVAMLESKVSKILNVLNDDEKGLAPFVTKLNSVANKIDEIKFKEISDNINDCIKEIKEGPILTNTNKTILETQKAIQDLDKLFVDIRQHPHNYVNFSLWGNKKRSNIKE